MKDVAAAAVEQKGTCSACGSARWQCMWDTRMKDVAAAAVVIDGCTPDNTYSLVTRKSFKCVFL